MPAIAASALVVDDEPGVRSLVQDILLGEGRPVLDAGDPGEALGVVEAHPIRVRLTGLLMPAMEGCELAKRVETVRSRTKVLSMSACVPTSSPSRSPSTP